MLKSLFAVSILIITVCLSLPFNYFSGDAVATVNGKSSGQFILAKELSGKDVFKLDGISVTLSSLNDLELLTQKLDVKLVHYFYDGEIENYYYFTEKLPKSEIVVGKKVNLHVAVNRSLITVGSPVIYYGY